jgi:ribosomal protein L17
MPRAKKLILNNKVVTHTRRKNLTPHRVQIANIKDKRALKDVFFGADIILVVCFLIFYHQ